MDTNQVENLYVSLKTFIKWLKAKNGLPSNNITSDDEEFLNCMNVFNLKPELRNDLADAVIFVKSNCELPDIIKNGSYTVQCNAVLLLIAFIYNEIFTYDDKDGFYNVCITEPIRNRYEVIESIGLGSFGEVVAAKDVLRKEHVAIKITTSDIYGKADFRREVFFLGLMNSKIVEENKKYLLELKNYFTYRGHGCLVLELLDRNLRYELRNTRSFPLRRIQHITRCILRGLEALHEMDVIHSDLKPENIAFLNDSSDDVKIIDFGNCIQRANARPGCHQTRLYRAPEVILRLLFGTAIDIWSVGCIAAEMFRGQTLFYGSDESQQFARMMKFLGTPPPQLTKPSSVFYKHFRQTEYSLIQKRLHKTRSFEKQISKLNYNSLESFLSPSRCPSFINFVKECLSWHPMFRPTASACLHHKWFFEVFDEENADTTKNIDGTICVERYYKTV